MAEHLRSGKIAEDLALNHLKSQGLKLVAQNWQCRCGEIDLIMINNHVVCFIEVRYRKQHEWGMAEETITYAKRRKLIKTAQLYLQQNCQYAMKPCQFDVVAITGELDSPKITWLTNAFALT